MKSVAESPAGASGTLHIDGNLEVSCDRYRKTWLMEDCVSSTCNYCQVNYWHDTTYAISMMLTSSGDLAVLRLKSWEYNMLQHWEPLPSEGRIMMPERRYFLESGSRSLVPVGR